MSGATAPPTLADRLRAKAAQWAAREPKSQMERLLREAADRIEELEARK